MPRIRFGHPKLILRLTSAFTDKTKRRGKINKRNQAVFNVVPVNVTKFVKYVGERMKQNVLIG